jgi:hypothetical protein
MNHELIIEVKMEREGFEPSKASADRFTVCSLWPLGYLSINYQRTVDLIKHSINESA